MGYPIKNTPFQGNYGLNKTVFPNAASVYAPINKNSDTVRLVNSGLNICYVKLGTGILVATTADTPVLPGSSLVISKSETQDVLAVVSASGTTLSVQTGISANVDSSTPVPLSEEGLVLWLDASDRGTVLLNGADVDTWYDKSGNGNDATQSTGSKQPEYILNSQNEKNTIRFVSTDSQVLDVGDIGENANNVFIVLKPKTSINSTSTPQQNFLNIFNLFYGFAVAYESKIIGIHMSGGKNAWNSTRDSLSGFNIINPSWDGTNYDIYVNGANKRNYKNGTPHLLMADAVTIGARKNYDKHFDGDIAEILIYNTSLTTVQRQKIEGYLGDKWGVDMRLPVTISSLSAWYDATDPNNNKTQFENNTPVSVWRDKSGNGYDVIQEIDAQMPTYLKNIVNNKPVLRFNNSKLKSVFGTTLSQPNTVFVVGKIASLLNNGHYIDGIESTKRHAMFVNFTSLKTIIRGSTSLTNDFIENFEWHINTALYNGGSSKLYINRVEKTGNVGNHTLTGLIIGVNYNDSGALVGDIAEIIIYNKLLTDSEIQRVETYLSNKWDIEIS